MLLLSLSPSFCMTSHICIYIYIYIYIYSFVFPVFKQIFVYDDVLCFALFLHVLEFLVYNYFATRHLNSFHHCIPANPHHIISSRFDQELHSNNQTTSPLCPYFVAPRTRPFPFIPRGYMHGLCKLPSSLLHPHLHLMFTQHPHHISQ